MPYQRSLPDEYQPLARVQRAHEAELLDKENVVGVGIGNKYVNGEDTGRLCIVVFVSRKMPPDLIPDDQMLPSRLGEDVLVDVKETGFLQPQQVQGLGALRLRPAVGGMSVSHQNGGSGTIAIGCMDNVLGSEVPGYCLLSNAHVLAMRELTGLVGDPVIQPGGGDGGTFPADSIGTITRIRPILFPVNPTAPQSSWFCNFVDGAIATCRLRDINREVHWIGYPKEFCPGNPWENPLAGTPGLQVGSDVQKVGRTTGYTRGEVTALNATVIVGPYGTTASGDPRLAKFCFQIMTTGMSDFGDSGSLVFNRWNVPIGLLFAGSNFQVSVANRLQDVEFELAVRIPTF